MTAAKRKISVMLDADLSRQVNEVARQRRRRLLAELLAELERAHGPVKKSLVGKYERLLGTWSSRHAS
jgi:hypothetical protein